MYRTSTIPLAVLFIGVLLVHNSTVVANNSNPAADTGKVTVSTPKPQKPKANSTSNGTDDYRNQTGKPVPTITPRPVTSEPWFLATSIGVPVAIIFTVLLCCCNRILENDEDDDRTGATSRMGMKSENKKSCKSTRQEMVKTEKTATDKSSTKSAKSTKDATATTTMTQSHQSTETMNIESTSTVPTDPELKLQNQKSKDKRKE